MRQLVKGNIVKVSLFFGDSARAIGLSFQNPVAASLICPDYGDQMGGV
jgi:hypothetical protein